MANGNAFCCGEGENSSIPLWGEGACLTVRGLQYSTLCLCVGVSQLPFCLQLTKTVYHNCFEEYFTT